MPGALAFAGPLIKTNTVKPPIGEAAGIEKTDIYDGYIRGNILENPDDLLRRKSAGRGLRLYERALLDPHIYSDYQKRWLAVTGKERQIVPGMADNRKARTAVKLIEPMIDSIHLLDQSLLGLLEGIHYGYCLAEIMWQVSEGDIWPERLIVRKPRVFKFDLQGNPRLLTMQNLLDGEELPPRKFQRFVFPGGGDNPYGAGLGQRLYWWEWFKRNNVKFWTMFNDRFASPTPIGKYPAGASDKEKETLSDVLAAIQHETGIRIPDTMAIDLLEAQRSSTVSTYGDFLSYCDGQISKVIVGQTLTTQVDGQGSYAASQTHKEVKDEITAADADLLCAYLNSELVKWLVDYNIPDLKPSEYPQIWIKTEEGDDLNERINRDEKLCRLVDVPASYIRETYSVPEPEGDEELASRPAAGAAPGSDDSAAAETQPGAEFAEASAVDRVSARGVKKTAGAYRDLFKEIERSLED